MTQELKPFASEKLVYLCNKFWQQTVSEHLWFSMDCVNKVINWKRPMSRLMKYTINEIVEEDIEYNLVLRKAIDYIWNKKERLATILHSLPEDIRIFCKNIK